MLLVNDPSDMLSDYTREDFLTYSFSKVHKCKTFRKNIKTQLNDGEHLYQLVNEHIEEELELEHAVSQRVYDKLLKEEE